VNNNKYNNLGQLC